jgi:Flp pilus assembly protein TadD
LAAAGRNQEAIEQYQHTIAKDQAEMRAYVGLAAVLAKSKRVTEAVKTIDRAIEVSRREGAEAGMKKLRALRARYQRMQSPKPGP